MDRRHLANGNQCLWDGITHDATLYPDQFELGIISNAVRMKRLRARQATEQASANSDLRKCREHRNHRHDRCGVARDHAGRYNVCAWSSAMSAGQTTQAKVSHWAKGTYDMVAEIIRKVARYDDEQHAVAHENERVRLTIAKLFADRFEADNAQVRPITLFEGLQRWIISADHLCGSRDGISRSQ